MADAPWYSLLPTAPTTQGAFNGADLAQQGQRQAIQNQQAQYNFGLQKTTEALMAASIDPQSGAVDQGRFYKLAAQTPYGVSAIKAYADVVFPQKQKQAVEFGGSAQSGAQGDRIIASDPTMAASLRAGVQAALTGPTSPLATTLGELRLKAPIASYNPSSSLPAGHWSQQSPTNQMAPQVQDMPSLTPPNIAAAYGSNATDAPPAPKWEQESSLSPAVPAEEKTAPGAYETAMSMEPNLGTQNSAPTKVPPFDASKLPAQQKAQLAQALKALNIDPSDLSAGATQAIQNEISAKRAAAIAPVLDKEGNPLPLETARNKAIFEASVPALIQEGYNKLLGIGREQTGANLGQVASALSNTGSEQVQNQVQKLRKEGFDANPGNAAAILERKGTFDWLKNTSDDIHTLRSEASKGAVDNDLFNSTISALSNAPMVAESITNLAGEHRFFENLRTDPSLGALIKSSDGNPVNFLRSLGSAKLGAQSQQKVLDILGNIVDTQLKTGKAKSDLDQYRLHWSKQMPAPGGSSRRKATAGDF